MIEHSRFVIFAERALVGKELRVASDVAITVDNGRIESVSASAPSTAGMDHVDARAMTVLPGFIDAHVHVAFYDPNEVLRGGVTTVRDLGWPPHEIWPLVARSRSNGFPGPLVVAAGPMLTAPAGYPTRASWAPPGTGLEVASPEQGRAAVDDIADRGAIVVKVAMNADAGPTLDPEVLAAIVHSAHDRHLRVTAHINGLGELDKALDAGVDELAHILMSPEAIPDATIHRLVETGVVIVPTLAVFSGRARDIAIDNVARFVAAGGHVIYGTDLGNDGPSPGIDALEVEGLVAAGFTGVDVTRAATVDGASWLGLEDRGAIAEGLRADLVAVAGDPTTDPNAVTRVEMVWRSGVRAR